MNKNILVAGMGELGSVFARGFLRLGYTVTPVTRNQTFNQLDPNLNPEAVLIAVGEGQLNDLLKEVPELWRDRLILIQNELLPRDWLAQNLANPTVISVWFEKKKGMDSKLVLPSPIFGKHSQLVKDALAQLDLPSYQVNSTEELEYELVRKNLYILSTNIAGLKTGGTVKNLADNHSELLNAVAQDVLDLQDWLTDKKQDRTKLMQGLLEAFAGDPEHQCMGRSAPARLARALYLADQAGLEVPTLRQITATTNN